MKSKTEVPNPEWLDGLGSEPLEQLLAFRDWMRSSLDDGHLETIKRGWLPFIGGERKEVR